MKAKEIPPRRETQRRQIAEYLLQHGRASALELQAKCNALHPPRRVFELRHDFGWRIDTLREKPFPSSHSLQYYALVKAGSMP